MKVLIKLFFILIAYIFVSSFSFLSLAKKEQTKLKQQESKQKSHKNKKEETENKQTSVLIQGKHLSSIDIQPAKEWDISGDIERKSRHKNQKLFLLKNKSAVRIQTPPQIILVVAESVDKITVKNLKNTTLHISVKTGSISITNSRGSFQVSVDNGQIDLTNNKGKLEVHSYAAPVTISQFDGSAVVRSYSGVVKVENSNGKWDVKSFSSSLSFFNTNGSLQFGGEKSDVKLKSHKGDVSGYSHKGSVTGSFTPSQVKIETVSGDIRLYFKSSKARVEAHSWEGKVLAPKYFYKDRAGGVYKAYGSIKDRGDHPGQVSLKSKTGKISIL